MDEAKQLVISRWHIKAQHDLVVAQSVLRIAPPVTDAACFHAQQCAEKMLKAFLVHLGIHVQKTHDLEQLLILCLPYDQTLQDLAVAADRLNLYAVESRYPDDWREIPLDEAAEAVQHAERVMAFIAAKLGLASAEALRGTSG